MAEVAAILRVSKQRVRELAARDETFPQPVAELSGGAIYVKSMIVAFEKQWDRRPGRPTKAQGQVAAELERIHKVKGNLEQQILRSTFNAIRMHDLATDPRTPPGQSLYRAIKLTDPNAEPDSTFQYDANFFQPEPPDQNYRERHAECCDLTLLDGGTG